jgi:hypothetical protein
VFFNTGSLHLNCIAKTVTYKNSSSSLIRMEQECATGFLTNKQIALEETKHTDSTKKPQENNN